MQRHIVPTQPPADHTWSRRRVRAEVLGWVIGALRRESQCDVDDPDFIDKAMIEQHRLADRLERELRNL